MNLVPDFEANQKGFYGELWTGTWFSNSYLAVKSQYGNDAFLIPLLFGTDDANVGGTTSAKPVILSLGIYPIEVRRIRLAVECIAYIPQVNGTKAQKQSTVFF